MSLLFSIPVPNTSIMAWKKKKRTRSHRHHECRQTRSDNQVHPQKVLCSHTNPPLELLQSDSWWDWLFQASWNRDSHTHMKQPCSFVNKGTLSSRQSACSMCVCVCLCVCLCARAAAPWSQGNEALSHTNVQPQLCPCVSFHHTHVLPGSFCACDWQNREGY